MFDCLQVATQLEQCHAQAAVQCGEKLVHSRLVDVTDLVVGGADQMYYRRLFDALRHGREHAFVDCDRFFGIAVGLQQIAETDPGDRVAWLPS